MDALKLNFEKVMAVAKSDGAKVELLVSGGENLSLGYSQRKLVKFESTQSQMAGLRVILGASQGYAYTENLEEEALLRSYREALNNAKTVGAAATSDVIELVKPAGKVERMDHLFRVEEVPMSEKLKNAQQIEELCLLQDARIQSVPYSSFNEGLSFRRVLNSEGVDQEFKQNYYSGYAYPLGKDGESSKMDGESFFVRSFAEIDIQRVAEAGVQKVLSRLGATKLKTGNYPVVISREVFSTVLSMFVGYLSAKNVFEKKSLFAGKLGQIMASAKFSLYDDPFETSCTSVRPFDSEGAPSQRTTLFENGVLKNFFTNLEFASKLGLPHTAHAARGPSSAMDIGPTNLIVAKGSASLEELLARYPRAVHLTHFAGGLHAGFKESTGDFSMPAEGFLYENGMKVGAVDQFVMSGNILTLLMDIEDVSSEQSRAGTSVLCPDVLVRSLSFAGA
jgi:PmbA protein